MSSNDDQLEKGARPRGAQRKLFPSLKRKVVVIGCETALVISQL